MSKPDVYATVCTLVEQTMSDKGVTLGPESKLLSAGGLFDSYSLMELVLRVEQAFEIRVPDEDLDPDVFESIESLADYVDGRLGTGEACDD